MDIQGTMTISIKDFNKIIEKIDNKSKEIVMLQDKVKELNILSGSKCGKLQKYAHKIEGIKELLSDTHKTSGIFTNKSSKNVNIISKIKIIINE